MPRPLFHIAKTPVYVPAVSLFGVFLLAWVAAPSLTEMLPGWSPSMVWLLAVAHALLVLVVVTAHELGHVLAGLKRGYVAPAVVVSWWAAKTMFDRKFERPRDLFWVTAGGPIVSVLLGGIGLAVAQFATEPIVGSFGIWVAWAGLGMGLVNLLPAPPLDGANLVTAGVWAATKDEQKARRVSGRIGLVVAFLWMSNPFILNVWLGWDVTYVDVMLSGLVGGYLALVSWGQLLAGRGQLPAAGDAAPVAPTFDLRVLARRAAAVPLGSSCSTAIEAARAAGAGAILITSETGVVGIVRDSAIGAVPSALLDQTKVETVARRVSDADRIPLDAVDLSEWLAAAHANEWLVVDAAGLAYGVLLRSDVENSV